MKRQQLALTLVPHDVNSMSPAERFYQYITTGSANFLTEQVLHEFGFTTDMNVDKIGAVSALYESIVCSLRLTPHRLYLHRIHDDLNALLKESVYDMIRYIDDEHRAEFENIHLKPARVNVILPQDDITDKIRDMQEWMMRYQFVKSGERYTDHNQAMSLAPINRLVTEFSSYRWDLPGVGTITRFGETFLGSPAISIGNKWYCMERRFIPRFPDDGDEHISIADWIYIVKHKIPCPLKDNNTICSMCDDYVAINLYDSINVSICQLCADELNTFINTLIKKWILLRTQLLPELQLGILALLLDNEMYW